MKSGELTGRGSGRLQGWEVKGDFLGLNVLVNEGGVSCSPDDIRDALKSFNTVHLLRTVGQLADRAFFGRRELPNTPDALAYIARAAIEVGSDDREELAGEEDIQRIAEMYHNLREQFLSDDGEALRILLRMGFGQLSAHPDPVNTLGRSWYIYLDLWKRVPKAVAFPVEKQLHDLMGAPYHQALALGIAYWGNARKGFTSPYQTEAQEKLGPRYRSTPDEAGRIFDWLSCSYDDVRGWACSPSSKYQLSPFAIWPLIKPDITPEDAAKDVRVVPLPSLVFERMTLGIFHALAGASDHGGKQNEFRTAFGYVFEAYIGELLRAGCGGATILPEFRYAKRDSPDWMVVEGENLLVVEVKASSLSLVAKTTGDLELATKDLRKNVGKGVDQLVSFQEDVLAGRTGNAALEGIKNVQLLLVTQDDVPYANFVYPQLIPGSAKIHVASVADLELLQRYCWGQSPFSLLVAKGNGSHSSRQDLGMYLRQWLGSPLRKRHPFLARITGAFLREVGAEVPLD